LISGGGSALLPLPTKGISLDDKLQVIRHLSSHGANIAELNTVRKHLSDVKGGGLLAACTSAPLITLVLSDVLGDPLDLIASGPTVQDTSTAADALEVLSRFDPQRQLPATVYAALASPRPTRSRPAAADSALTIVIGNNPLAVDQAAQAAEHYFVDVVRESAPRCEGSAETIGRDIARRILSALKHGRPMCLVSGGEPTVELADASVRGLGGRNQQLVLAAYQQLRQAELSDEAWRRIALLSGGTDGEDGPTDAAGAVLDADVHARSLKSDLDLNDFLRRNDAYHFFQPAGGLLMTGPTGTNVCDLRIALLK
jgi:glycerate-2-kinase